ncbi:MAG: PRC-barrel domain-containing protein [Pseudomonadota bacterium]
MKRWFLALWLSAMLSPTWADVSKASDWVGRTVVTTDGEPLGRIEDLALDVETGRIAFWVISVGSFLIEDSLIAVHPDALGPSAQGDALVLHSDRLAQARRFNESNWPDAPDVLAVDPPDDAQLVSAAEDAPPSQPGFTRSGSATISDGRRQAIFADGERRIEPLRRGSATAADATSSANAAASANAAIDPQSLALPAFSELDRDGDGLLDRREIGPRLGRSETFTAVDVDSSGRIDAFEFDLLRDSRE